MSSDLYSILLSSSIIKKIYKRERESEREREKENDNEKKYKEKMCREGRGKRKEEIGYEKITYY